MKKSSLLICGLALCLLGSVQLEAMRDPQQCTVGQYPPQCPSGQTCAFDPYLDGGGICCPSGSNFACDLHCCPPTTCCDETNATCTSSACGVSHTKKSAPKSQ
ncbi:MAG TPA: hypothetical protein VMW10_03155 [Alphaproteobacteria bacterium]|nr:hypothetical protein [Alphaproteobacteria bacterium]